MKSKFIALIISISLIISCGFIYINNNSVISVGAGNGKNAKVENLSDLSDVLDFLCQKQENETISSYSRKLASSNDEKDRSTNHTSATIHVQTNMTLDLTSSNSYYVKDVHQSLKRDMTVYITEDATYYEVNGIITGSSAGQYGSNKNLTKLNACLLFTNEKVYVKFNEFIIVTQAFSGQIKNSNKGKWIECDSYDMISDMLDVDSANRDVLLLFDSLITYMLEEGIMGYNADSVNLSGDELFEILNEIGRFSDFNLGNNTENSCKLNIDLSSRTNPYIHEYFKIEDSQTKKFQYETYNGSYADTSVTIKTEVTAEETLSIKNIDNTVINFNTENVEIVCKSVEAFDRLFSVSEKDEEED